MELKKLRRYCHLKAVTRHQYKRFCQQIRKNATAIFQIRRTFTRLFSVLRKEFLFQKKTFARNQFNVKLLLFYQLSI